MSHRLAVLLFCLLIAPLATGCRVLPFWLRQDDVQLPPEAFTDVPSMDEAIYAVNANTERVEQLRTENATLRCEGIAMPALRLNMAYERPRHFRLRAELSQFTGRELDLGSNDELFWFWIRRAQQPGIYYARHDEFAVSPARDLIPIEPHRLPETLGLVRFEQTEHHAGPTLRDNLLEIRSRIPSPRGDMTRVILLDATYGWIVEQHYYDASGQLLFSARASEHRYYPDDAVTMPHRVEVQVLPGQPAQLAFEIEVGRFMFNRLSGERSELWSLPTIEGVPAVDIADPDFQPPGAPDVSSEYGPNATVPTAPYRQGTPPGMLPPYSEWTHGGDSSAPGGSPSVSRRQRMARLPAYRGYE
ncbi:MAG: hypothetical protein ACQESR_29710 [Planctomycetota bacterium]